MEVDTLRRRLLPSAAPRGQWGAGATELGLLSFLPGCADMGHGFCQDPHVILTEHQRHSLTQEDAGLRISVSRPACHPVGSSEWEGKGEVTCFSR